MVAVAALRALLSDPSASIRLGAARAILDNTMKMRESAELASRVDEIEAKLADTVR